MDRIVIVTKRTRLEDLVKEHLSKRSAKFFLESLGQSISSYENEDMVYQKAIKDIRLQIPGVIPVTLVEREDLPNFLFRETDFIIVCGPDGLFVNLAQYLGSQAVLTVNPDKSTVTGKLMLFEPKRVGSIIADVQMNKHRTEALPLVKAFIDRDNVIWGVNDIFIGRKDQISSRYEILFEGVKEHHSSSGIIIATGIGSTGWISSVQNMVNSISRGGSSRLSNLPSATSNELAFVVREPFKLPDTGVSIVTGRITPGNPLIVNSEMPNGGCIFSDGMIEKSITWNAGITVTVSIGDRYIRRIIG